ncbi:DegT/DnrJ/EryC1/StrS family aminotransferase [candidate division KSB1 bacterium]|nr:DegT/DnrJ/EryC1/StrS family aminotransferase [candidate division KSB1 bacterium]
MKTIDLRSDTITKPTPGMRKAIAEAQVGDDVFGEDPTINELQKRVAGLLGKDAALFVASGTMANQISIKCHTQPGDEVICEADSHIFNYEGGSPAFLSGVQLCPLQGTNGVISPEQIKTALRPKDSHYPQSGLIALENTHNRAGGTIFPLDAIKAIRETADFYDLPMHLDGARLWNAHVETGIPLEEYGKYFDSVSVCFSKGLGAPVGSMITGSIEFINKAHRYRKMLGGGMRQAGILAAAGLYALDYHLERLADDHKRARIIAEFLNGIKGVYVNLNETRTNIVIADFKDYGQDASVIAEKLKEQGLLCIPFSATKIRFVTHLEIDDQDIEFALKLFKIVLDKKDL